MDETKLQSYIDKIKEIQNIDLSNLTDEEKLNFDSLQIEEYANALEGLESKQAALLLSTQGLSNAQIQQTLETRGLTEAKQYQAMLDAGLLKSKQQLTNVELQNNLAKTLSKTMSEEEAVAKSKELMASMGLTVAEEGEESQTVKLTRAKLTELVTSGKLTQAQAQEIAARTGVLFVMEEQNAVAPMWIVHMKKMALATWEQVRATITWLATNPAGWCIMAATAIIGLIKVIEVATVSVEEQRKKLDDLKQEYNEITSKLGSLNSELSTTEQRMKELEKIKSPSFTEKEEYDNLVKTNNELQREIDLLKLEESIKNGDLRKAFVSTMEKDTDYLKDKDDKYFYYIDPHNLNLQRRLGKGSTLPYSMRGSLIEAIPEDELISIYEDYKKQLDELNEEYADDLGNRTYLKSKEKIKQEIEELATYLQEKSTQWASDSSDIYYITNPTTEDDKAVNEWLDYIADFQDRMAIAMDGNNAKTNAFNRIVDNWYFDDTVQELQDLGKQGQVTADMLNDPKYDEFIEKLLFLGMIDSKDNLDDIALAFNKTSEAINSVEDSSRSNLLSISETIDQLNTRLKPALDSLQSAYQDIFTDDGTFGLNSIDILSTCDSIKSKLDDLNEIEGITVDYTAFEDFATVLRNTESTEHDVETAFDSLATSVTQAALSGAEDFETMKSALEDLGVANSEMVAFDALIKNTEALKEAGLDLADATYPEMVAFTKAQVSAENFNEALNLLRIQKILCAENPLNTTADIQNLYNLAQATGIATNAIQALMTLNTAYTKASSEGNTLVATAVKGQMELVKKQVMDQFANLGSNVDFSNIGGGTKSASKAGSSAGDAYVDAFEEELKALEDLRDNGLISEKEYLDRLRVT